MIDPSTYTGNEIMYIKAIQTDWLYKPYWRDYQITMSVGGLSIFTYKILTEKSPIEYTRW